ncbi:hypothetical protein CKF42_12585 [Pantoea sp. ARC270]|nr:hypothetical protein CKF42_12585 [Pantoea sp. ARC270]
MSPSGDIYLADFIRLLNRCDFVSLSDDTPPLSSSDFSHGEAGQGRQYAEKYNHLFSGTELAIILQLLIHLFMIAPPGGKELIKPE